RSTPKHVLPLGESGRPLLRETYERASRLASEVFVLTETGQRAIIQQVLPELDSAHLILEPAARGTTNAYGLAALTLRETHPDSVMLVLPADHVVGGRAGAAKAVRAAVHAAATSDSLVTVGLKPRFPSTGLGYIHAPGRMTGGALRVKRFTEKPDPATARRFIKAGGYYWNLAWFSWRLDVFIDELGRYAPRHLAGLREVMAARAAGNEAAAAATYKRLRVDVIDRSVMERTDRLLLVPGDFEWADIGNWAELGDRVRADVRGNSVEGESILVDTTGSLILGSRRLVAAIGLDDMIIVDTEDAILVCPRSRAQDVRKVVDALRRAGKTRYL
ncbi:MAG: mannose-phosphate guanylyltransferase / mannose-6-phosphate isomerase, partial [Chloroflexota bacterium]|nr:mannose-phosphate guanylyltransferase / mannose-6-phosphate isomerase [Chloroflexota bacterium]